MPLKITVPFTEKDHAKSKGAFWSVEDKTWFVPNHKNYQDFAPWIKEEQAGLILQSPYYVAISSRNCWKCKQETNVVALAAENYYTLDYEDEDDEQAKQVWFKQHEFVFLSDTVFLDAASAIEISGRYPFYRLGYSRTKDYHYWANHCQHCSAIQGDFFLHQEPGEAFCPTTIEECQALTLVKITTKYDCLLAASVGWSSNGDDIKRHAQRA